MSKYILDLTGISPAHPLHGLKIQCRDGQHFKDFDVDECDLPREVFQRLHDAAKISGKDTSIPIGFNVSRLPSDAIKLVRIV